jgi:hypothetical protein
MVEHAEAMLTPAGRQARAARFAEHEAIVEERRAMLAEFEKQWNARKVATA